MQKQIIRLAMAAGLVMAAAACVPPTPPVDPGVQELDQEFVPSSLTFSQGVPVCATSNPGVTDFQAAQTFTAGKTGMLDKVALVAWRPIPSGTGQPVPLAISIQTIDVDGEPSGVEIGSGIYDGNGTSLALTEMPLAAPASVVHGQSYALVAYESACPNPEPVYGWEIRGAFTETDGYANGGAFRTNSLTDWTAINPSLSGPGFADLAFKTWVT